MTPESRLCTNDAKMVAGDAFSKKMKLKDPNNIYMTAEQMASKVLLKL